MTRTTRAPGTMGYGEPADVAGECNAHLYVADNFGDNHTTFRCERHKGHDGMHGEAFRRDGGLIQVQWEKDERDYDSEVASSEESDADPGGR